MGGQGLLGCSEESGAQAGDYFLTFSNSLQIHSRCYFQIHLKMLFFYHDPLPPLIYLYSPNISNSLSKQNNLLVYNA